MTGMETFEMDNVQNERARPRVLIVGLNLVAVALQAQLLKTLATVERVQYISEVNQEEWDCVVTDTIPAHVEHRNMSRAQMTAPGWTSAQHFDSKLCLILFRGSSDTGSDEQRIDAPPASYMEARQKLTAIVMKGGVVGNHVSKLKDLPPDLDAAVTSSLIPAVNDRGKHVIFSRTDEEGSTEMELRPFLLGPQGLPLAASYERNAEASVWLLPSDVRDHSIFVLSALREWHVKYGAARFPIVGDWSEDADFHTQEESRLLSELETIQGEIEANLDRLRSERKSIEAKLEIERIRAGEFERALLTEDGPELQSAILRTLVTLGFNVTDMDAQKDKSGVREDFQIRDADDTNWICIADSKGSKGPPGEDGLLKVMKWTRQYLSETGDSPTGQWVIVNFQRAVAPDERREPFQNNPSVLAAFEEDSGLVLDTRALFRLLRIVQDCPEVASSIREFLRSQTGVLSGSLVASRGWPEFAERESTGTKPVGEP